MSPYKARRKKKPFGLQWLHDYRRRRRRRGKTRQGLFTEIYQGETWRLGEEHSHSGTGSSLERTETLRMQLPGLIEELGVRTFFDAPCGDLFWFQHVALRNGVHYIGADIVEALIDTNAARFGNEAREFRVVDLCGDPLPAADLWMCRDCLIHLSYEDIERLLRNFVSSGIPWLLTTTYPAFEENRDILTGRFRPINLERQPFSLPPPERVLGDAVEDEGRVQGLWSREAIQGVLARSAR